MSSHLKIGSMVDYKANIYMEHFEKLAIRSSPLKPGFWVRFVDDTNVKWDHGMENLRKIVEHLNSNLKHFQFIMEVEEHDSIPFLDVFLSRWEDGTLSHQVFWKETQYEL